MLLKEGFFGYVITFGCSYGNAWPINSKNGGPGRAAVSRGSSSDCGAHAGHHQARCHSVCRPDSGGDKITRIHHLTSKNLEKVFYSAGYVLFWCGMFRKGG